MNVDAQAISELVDNYSKGELSPVEIVTAALDKAEESQNTINAFVTICRAEALAQAVTAETHFRKKKKYSPLAGVPITVKDVIPTKGIRTTFGSLSYASNVPTNDAVAVDRLRNAGAIIIGKTTTPEGACRQTTSSMLCGVTRNPLALDLTPGGSSGGSSAATAYGAGYISLVTDGGGSARLPAACTGIVGFKPTFGWVPYNTAPDAFGGLAHIGLMGRSIADVSLAFSNITGPHPSDPYSLAAVAQVRLKDRGSQLLSGLRIGWRERLNSEIVDPAVLGPVRQGLSVLAALGANVECVKGDIPAPLPTWLVLQNAIWSARWGKLVSDGAKIDPVIKNGVEQASKLSASDLQKAFHGCTELFRLVQSWFEIYDVIISPTIARTPIAADHPSSGPIEVAGVTAGDIREVWAPQMGLFTMTGHPALTLNCGWTHTGLPVGIHLTGRWHEDTALLDVAAALEAALPEAKLKARPMDKYSR